MKYRVLDLIVCPAGKHMKLESPVVEEVGVPEEAIDKVFCTSYCAFRDCAPADGVTPADCRECFAQEIISGQLTTDAGKRFAVTEGVPRLIEEEDLDSETQKTFSLEWKYSKPDERNWGESIELRDQKFFAGTGLDPESCRGKLMLNAGCGSGLLDEHLVENRGFEILAMDQSTSPFRVQQRKSTPFLYPIQGSVLAPPIRKDAFDLVYSAGVLHHTRNTKEAFTKVSRAVKPGGRFFIWLYHPIDKKHYPKKRLKNALYYWLRQNVTSRLPHFLQEALFSAMMVPFLVKQRIDYKLGKRKTLLTWGEKMQCFTDQFSPRFAWRHSEEEAAGWYEELGFKDPTGGDHGEFGFGIRGDRPADATPKVLS